MKRITPVNRENMYKWILEVLAGKKLTAYEVAAELYKKGYIPLATRQATAPRLTELEQTNKVAVVGKKVDENTHKIVSIYEVVEDGK